MTAGPMSNELVVFVTAPNMDDARRIAKELVSERLAACVSLIPGVESVYTWDDQLEVAAETMLVIKTTKARYNQLEKQIVSMHQYTTPEIIGLRIECGLASYLKWLRDSTQAAI
jgi:periplasmic divalent cation tolerance protein